MNMHIVIDFGGADIDIGLVQNGTVISKTRLPAVSQGGLLRRLSGVIGSIYQLLSESRYSISECTGIGIATSGVVDPTRRTLISINDKYTDAKGFPFAQWFEEIFGLPCILENDAEAALIGEAAYGVARGETNAVLLGVSRLIEIKQSPKDVSQN
jgi:glucokinase